MRIAVISAGMPRAAAVVKDTIAELGDEVSVLDLNSAGAAFYGGDFNPAAGEAFSGAAGSDGIVFVLGGSPALPSFRIAAFIEYARFYPGALAGRNCFVVSGGPAASFAFGEALRALGACDAVRAEWVEPEPENDETLELLEKQTEDFFRIVRQRRKTPAPKAARNPDAPENPPAPRPRREEKTSSPVNIADLYEKHQPATQRGKRDVAELAGLYAKKFKQSGESVSLSGMEELPKPSAVPSGKTLLQLTTALTRHYKGGGGALPAAFQFHIEGEGGFDGYITAGQSSCPFTPGAHERPDITMIAGETDWRDVVTGKVSAKKAFMVGRLKVRGNFMLLTRFDEMFDFSAAG
jgi:putative sterol carrier protein